jgi:hypothetical protein
MTGHRYSKNEFGQWTRTTMAFEFFAQWERRFPHKDHGANSGNRRLGNKSLPPRNYNIWPVCEKIILK